MFQFFRKKYKPAPSLPKQSIPHRLGLTLELWRSRPDYVQQTKQLLANKFFQEMLSVLHHELPLNSIDAVIAHKRCLRMIELLATSPEVPPESTPSTFGAEIEFPELITDEETLTT
jgi:hypothetical protein